VRVATSTLGVPAATDDAIRREVAEKLTRVKPGGSFWFIFIGHGAATADGKDGVLVGPDAQQSVEDLYGRSVRQRELFDLLPKGAQAQAIFVIDACFSGRGSNGSPIAEGVGVKKAAIITAGAGKQFAGPLPGLKVPASSSLMLGALRGWADANNDNTVTAAEAVQYANDALAATLQGRVQTPALNPEAAGPWALAKVRGPREPGPSLNEIALWIASGGSAAVTAAPAPDVVPAEPVVVSGKRQAEVGVLTDPTPVPPGGGGVPSGTTDVGQPLTVMGSLDKDLIREVIHANRAQIRFCSDAQLTRFPRLEGKVAIRFIIAEQGTVGKSEVAQTTVNNAALEACIALRVRSWLFPKPKGGVVVVTYPFIFKQSGS